MAALSPNRKLVSDLTEALRQGAEDAFSTGYPSGFPFHNLHVEVVAVDWEPGTTPHAYRVALVQVSDPPYHMAPHVTSATRP